MFEVYSIQILVNNSMNWPIKISVIKNNFIGFFFINLPSVVFILLTPLLQKNSTYFCVYRYYEAALRSSYLAEEDGMNLRHDLAKLLIKLRKYKAAVRVLRSGLTVMAGSISSACTTTLLSESARFAFCDSDYHDRATSIKGGGFGEKSSEKICR